MTIPVRLGLQQRVLPDYRVPFFDTLAQACPEGLAVFAGKPRADEMIETRANLKLAHFTPADNYHFLSGSLYLCWQYGFVRWLRAWNPQILIVEANPRYLHTSSAVAWMHQRGRKVIGWGLGSVPVSGALSGLRLANRRKFLQQFDALITYSKLGAQQYQEIGFPPERIFVSPNAVAPRPTTPTNTRPGTFASGKPVILFVGRLQARKRLDLLLRSCSQLIGAQEPELWIIGEGPERAELEGMARRVYPQTKFIGAMHGSDLDPFFAMADLFVLPGTGGLAVQQAMAHGLPIIVADGDGTQADLVRPGNGWCIPPGDGEALTACLRTALADPVQLRRMGNESLRIVAEEINLETMVDAFSRAVESVIGG